MHTFIDIALNNCCTYTCDYCYSKASRASAINHSGKGTYIPHGHQIRAMELIAFLDKFPDDAIIQLSGGEPLIYPAFELLAARLLMKFNNIIVNTNANQLWRIDKQLKDTLWWRPSWHPDYRNMQAFKEDIKDLPTDKTLVNYVAHPKRIEDKSINDDLIDLEIELSLKSAFKYEVTCFEGDWNGLTFNKTWHQYPKYSTYYSKPIEDNEKIYISIKPDGSVMKCHTIKFTSIYDCDTFNISDLTPSQGCSIDNHTLCPLEYSAKILGVI